MAAGKPIRKRVRAAIVKAKLQQQGATLKAAGGSIRASALVATLGKQVRSGNPDNMESQGARIYWELLFGQDFRCDQSAGAINALLKPSFVY